MILEALDIPLDYHQIIIEYLVWVHLLELPPVLLWTHIMVVEKIIMEVLVLQQECHLSVTSLNYKYIILHPLYLYDICVI